MAWYKLFLGNPATAAPVVETFTSATFLFSTTAFIESGEVSSGTGTSNSRKLRRKREKFYAY